MVWDHQAAGSIPVTRTKTAVLTAKRSRRVGILCGFVIVEKVMNEAKNILNEFKIIMGSANVTNQYVELQKRYFESHYFDQNSTPGNLEETSKRYGLNLSSLYDKHKIDTNISNSYILNIHASFTYFIDQYCELPGFPFGGNTEKIDSLTWIVSNLYAKESDRPDDMQVWYEICNYYRLVRNKIVHMKNKKQLTHELEVSHERIHRNICKYPVWKDFCGALSAPNKIANISFDDQVLFSKAALYMAIHIFENTKYNLHKHAEAERSSIYDLICKYKKNPERKYSILKTYFSRIYPIKENDYDEELRMIASELS